MYEGKKTDDEFSGDDHMYEPGELLDQIRSMSNFEFDQYIEELKKQENKK